MNLTTADKALLQKKGISEEKFLLALAEFFRAKLVRELTI